MYLYKRSDGLLRYVIKSVILSLLLVSVVTIILDRFFEVLGETSPTENITFYDVIGGSVISPIIESIAISLILFFLSLFFNNINLKALIVSFIMSYFHYLAFPFWGAITLVSFFIFSVGYLVWYEESVFHGFCVCTLIHFGLNFISLSMVYVGQFYF